MTFFELGDYLYDTITGGKKTTDRSVEEIKKAGKQYESEMADIAKNTKSAKELYQEGKEAAAAAANNEAGIAAKNAKATSMQISGSKLLSAIQGAEAANKATQEGYNSTASNIADLGAGIQSEKNAALANAAKGKYDAIIESMGMKAKQAQERSNTDKSRLAQLGAAFIQGLGN